jgi:Protein of unknown function (DUF3606)
MATAKKKTARGRKQDRARVAGRQNYEVKYESRKTGRSVSAVKKGPSRRSAIAASGSKGGSAAKPTSLAGAGLPVPTF